MINLFLTGGKGFLGKHIFKRWEDNICLYERGQNPNKMIEYNPDFVIHGAAEIYKDSQMFESNLKLTYELLEAARKAENLRAFVYIGSSSEYGRKRKPMKETDLLEPTTMYEATKGACSLMCQAYAKTYGLPVMIARPFSLYGKYEPAHRLIPTAIKAAKAGWEMRVAPGTHDFIHMDDFINGLFMLLSEPHPGEIFNFGTGIQRTNDEVITTVERYTRRKVKRLPVPQMRVFDSDMWVCDTAKTKRVLGWEPKISFEEGIKALCHT